MKFLEWLVISILWLTLGWIIGLALYTGLSSAQGLDRQVVHKPIPMPCADCLIASYECEVKSLTETKTQKDYEAAKRVCQAEFTGCYKSSMCEEK